MKTYYVLFSNSTDGMAMYSKLKSKNIKTTIAPTPRKLSTSCGISLMFKEEAMVESIKNIAEENKLNYIRIDFVNDSFNSNRGKYC